VRWSFIKSDTSSRSLKGVASQKVRSASRCLSLRYRQAVTIADLIGECLILPERCTFLQDVMDALACIGGMARVVYRTDHDDRALALVAAGPGLALVPDGFVIPGVKQVPVQDLGLSRTIGLVWPDERKNSDVEEFIASLKNIAGRRSGCGCSGSDGVFCRS
jgi:DNA-binding transcriptional LysR family regulator